MKGIERWGEWGMGDGEWGERTGRTKMRAYIMVLFIKKCITFRSDWVQSMLVGKGIMFSYIRVAGSIFLGYDMIKSFVLCRILYI